MTMPRGPLVFLSLSLLCSAAITVHTFVAPDGWDRREHVLRDLDGITAEIARDSRKVAELKAAVSAMRRRPEVQERVVRDELGYVREGDLVIELDAPMK